MVFWIKMSKNWGFGKNYCKQLKVALALGVRKLGLLSIVSKLGEFPLFDGFLDLADFWDLDDFWTFDVFPVFDNFLHFSIDSSPSLMPLTSLAASILLAANTCNDTIVFSIDVNGAAILLKP